MSATCLIAQPIHPVGAELLRAAGITVLEPRGVDAIRAAMPEADAVIVRDGLNAELLDAAPRLAVIANHGTGTDKIDVAHAARLGIPVTCTPGANTRAVAEHALMLMLAVSRQAVAADGATRRGEWAFKYRQPFLSLSGRTLGVVGFGRTGRVLCEMASRGLGMRVLAWSPNADPRDLAACGATAAASFDALLQAADVVSLHRPLRADTRHTLDAAALRQMKPTAIVVNTSRGGLIDEAALCAALREGRIFGAGLDVFETEPFASHAELAALANVLLTPHVAGSSQEALHATASQCAQQVIAALGGQMPEDLVRPEVWLRRRWPVVVSPVSMSSLSHS
ncbi:hydroxyacid dehydrogenase [Xylophilus sp. GOD-11R]|uniref:hydroxyacid dehydrogenase n=1 Tax=Xylophilus sp. GOD-11R TaxID=3089814 RepID=UPI00298C84FB|nr:hydroxyacid dehydrogenase [Xylophilus sp. GOD-11R]WPB55653.1 hydroxyacid dehydrogenase [Xylophilus sp. GOD-11R]